MATQRKDASTNHHNQVVLRDACVVNETLERLSARWKMQVLYCIHQGQNRFSLLKELFPTLSDHVLGQRLRALEEEQLTTRQTNKSTVPPQIQYFATPKGVALLVIMQDLTKWERSYASD
jgi:DNA-binding HxlR family transcriptional regulator